MIEQLEKDLEGIISTIERAAASLNTLHGQKQGLEHAIKAIKAAAIAPDQVLDTSSATDIEAATQPPQESQNG